MANTKSGFNRVYGSSVLLPLTPANNYDPRVIIFGGGQPTGNATTEIIDLGAGSPSWVYGPDMSQARVEMDAVLLPTGKVLALAGSATDEQASTASLNADLYDPATNRFSSAGANAYPRMYHTVALLMPDATVWLAGSNPSTGVYEQHMEIYQPAYLFTRDGNNNVIPATRPTITSVPGTINWGAQFAVTTPDAASVSSAVLMKPDSSTHAFGLDQRLVGLNFTAGSGTLTVTGPPNANIAPPGYYMLFLINSHGVPSVAKFVLLSGSGSNPPPSPASVSPASGTTAGAMPVTINGTGFQAGATVTFGGTAATNVNVGSGTSITATTPAHGAGTVDVVVTNPDDQSGTLSGGYTYTSGAGGGGGISFVQVTSKVATSGSSMAITYPAAQTAGNLNVVEVMWGDTTSAVSTVADNRGNTYALAVGPTKVTGLTSAIYYAKNIAGGSTTVTVTFNQTAAYPNINILEYSGLNTSSPLDVFSAATGSGTTANSGSATTTAASELIVGAGNPSSGFTAAGSGFTKRLVNAYGGIAEDEIVSSTGSYSATATMTSGTYVMQMATFRASSQGTGNPAPTVSSISPTSGTTAGGTAVTINGTGFLAGATVTIGGMAATGVTVASGTSITATTPVHSAGAADVVVKNTDGQSATLSGGFTYTTPNPAPTVNGISPTSGTTAGGTPVSISGTGFLAGATVTIGGTAATGVNVVNSTSITATTPAHSAGGVNVTVTNTDDQSGTLTSGFTYTTTNPAPTVSGITPNSGTTAGGTPVTISGTGFLAGVTVTIGGTAATGVNVVNSTSITATTPAHSAGGVNVTVTNTDGQSGTLTSGFTYTTSSGGGGIAFVQSNSAPNTLQHSLSSVAATFSLPQTAGNLNVVVVGWGDVTSLVSTVKDSMGNVYTQAGGTVTGSGLRQAIFFAKSIAGGSNNTVTATFSQVATYPDIRILEYSGLDPSNPLDATATGVGTGTVATTAGANTSAANELIFGAGNNGDGFSGAGSGFTSRMIDYYGNLAEDKTVSSTGSYSVSAPLKKSTVWVMQMATFKASP